MKKIISLFLISSVLIIGCTNGCNDEEADLPGEDSANVNLGELPDSVRMSVLQDSLRSSLSKDAVLTGLTKEVFTIFKNKNYIQLDSLIHPEEGLRFSPYATVQPEDKKFSREGFRKLVTANKNQKMNWGSYDGSGDLISLTPTEYFKKFVYDANFVNPEKYDINNVIKTGNSVSNIKNVYKGGDFTESYFSGSKKNGGLDWKSVRLIFKEVNGKYYLVGIVHDQWTI